MITLDSKVFMERLKDALDTICLDISDKQEGVLKDDIWSSPVKIGVFEGFNIVLGLTDAQIEEPICGDMVVKEAEKAVARNGGNVTLFNSSTAMSLPLSPEKPRFYYSEDYRKLAIRVTKVRSYITTGHIRSFGGSKKNQTKRITIGRVDTIKYEEAIVIARKIQDACKKGIDPTKSPDYMKLIANSKPKTPEKIPPWKSI